MSPIPLIELQRRLAEAGRIRMGERTEKGAPTRLTTWRITSTSEELVKQAAGLYGGTPKPWESPTGAQWEVITESAELPVLIMPGYSLRQGYEFRTSPTLVERRCDGIEMDDGRPCLCNSISAAAGSEQHCKLITRLTVALPELTTMLGWRLETKGENAARELLASMDLVHGIAAGRPFVPARLKIVERRGNVNGQAVRYVVPVVDVQVRYAEILGGESSTPSAALPAGYKPIEAPKENGASLEEGLALAETQTLKRTTRSAAPIPKTDELEFSGAPTPDEEPGAVSPPQGLPPAPDHDLKPTKRQLAKLNALVGGLRYGGFIQTEHLWAALANSRKFDAEQMIELLGGRYWPDGEEGKGLAPLHWSPLRDDLTRQEASDLIDRLERLEKNAKAMESAPVSA